jgi:hypothetical protein
LAAKRHKESQKETAAGEFIDGSRPPGGRRSQLHGIIFFILEKAIGFHAKGAKHAMTER